MNNNIDDWLNSLGLDNQPSALERIEPSPPHPVEPVSIVPVPEEPATQDLTDDDFNDILSDLGFEEAVEAVEVEEVEEEESNTDTYADSYDENGGESRDLDAEEDADWDIRPLRRITPPASSDPIEFDPASVADQEVHIWTEFQRSEVGTPTENISPDEDDTSYQTEPSEPLLPENSPTLLIDDSTSRFSGTEWFSEVQKQRIIVAGIGGIGSNLAFQLARMHPDALFLYDDDIVETGNMSGQLFSRDDAGSDKVRAITRMIINYTSMEQIYALNKKFTPDCEAGDIMMCGFDSMEARELFFASWHSHVMDKPEEERKKCLYLDGRLSIDTLQVFCITGDDLYSQTEYVTKYLFSDREADETVCSMKQTTYLACMIASLMTNLFTNFVAGTLDPVIPYDLPFFTEYDAQNMIFKTKN